MYNNPFDFTKVFNQYDPAAAMNEQMQKMFSQFSVPNVDMKALMAAQQANLDAVTAANRAAVDGMQELMKRQAEIVQEAMSEGASLAGNVDLSGDPAELSKNQAKLVEETMKKALANAAELGDIVTKTQQEANTLITERFDAAMKELKESMPNK